MNRLLISYRRNFYVNKKWLSDFARNVYLDNK